MSDTLVIPFSQRSEEFSAGSILGDPQTEKPCGRAGEALSTDPTTGPAVSPDRTGWSSCRCCVTGCGPASGYWWSWTPVGRSSQTSPAALCPGSSSVAGPSSDTEPRHVFDHHLNLCNINSQKCISDICNSNVFDQIFLHTHIHTLYIQFSIL